MESKQITLRSQTVQCPHCGEYYSVTYKYCPFCEDARREEQERIAEKKANSVFAGLFGHGKEKDSGRGAGGRERSSGGRERGSGERSRERGGSDRRRDRSGARKKLSEMTEEERAAWNAERAARAAQRKRERDLARMGTTVNVTPGEPTGPVFEDLPMPDIFQEAEEVDLFREEAPEEQTSRNPFLETADDEEAYLDDDAPDAGNPFIEEAILPTGEQSEIPPETAPEAPEAPAASHPLIEDIPPMPAPAAEVPVEQKETAPAAAPAEQKQAAPAAETAPAAQEADSLWDPQVKEPEEKPKNKGFSFLKGLMSQTPETAPEIPPAPGGENVNPATVAGQPIREPEPEKPIESPEELDAFLREVKGMLGEPVEPPPQAEEPAPENLPQAASVPEPAPVQPEASAQTETAPAQTEAGEPQTQEPQFAQIQEPQDGEQAEAEGDPDVPEEDPQFLWQTAGAAQATQGSAPEGGVVPARQRKKADGRNRAEDPEQSGDRRTVRAQRRKKKQQQTMLLRLLLAGVALLVLILLISKVIVPALRAGETEEVVATEVTDTADSLTFDKWEINLYEPNAVDSIFPEFAPEGSYAQLTWTTSDPGVATVDSYGNVTAVYPGSAMITASMANGQSAQCSVNCAWNPEDFPTPGTGLNTTEISLSGEGVTEQLYLEGVEGFVTWSSSKPSVATVSQEGLVTAISKGGTTITAEVNGQRFNCEVRCVW